MDQELIKSLWSLACMRQHTHTPHTSECHLGGLSSHKKQAKKNGWDDSKLIRKNNV